MSKPFQLLEITAQGCASCVTMGVMIQNIASRNEEIEAITKDVQEFDASQLKKLGVERTPALLFLKEQQVLGIVYGYQPEEILEIWIESKIHSL